MAFLSRFSKKNRRAARRKKQEKQGGGRAPAGATVAAAVTSVPSHDRTNFFSPKKLMSSKRQSVPVVAPPSPLAPTLVTSATSPPQTPTKDVSQTHTRSVQTQTVPRSRTTSTIAEQVPAPAAGLLTPQHSTHKTALVEELPLPRQLEPRQIPVHELTNSSPSSRSLYSQLTDLTQVDDGLTDWGLPKVLTGHEDADDYKPMQFSTQLESKLYALEPVDEYLSIKSSVDEWFEAQEQIVVRRPSARQVRAMKLLIVLYFAVILHRSGKTLPRYAKKEIVVPEAPRSLFFVPWL